MNSRSFVSLLQPRRTKFLFPAITNKQTVSSYQIQIQIRILYIYLEREERPEAAMLVEKEKEEASWKCEEDEDEIKGREDAQETEFGANPKVSINLVISFCFR